MAKSLTRRANEPPRTQRRRSDTCGAHALIQHMPHPVEVPETDFEDAELFYDTLDCMYPWYEPESYFYYGDDFQLPDYTDAYSQLEL